MTSLREILNGLSQLQRDALMIAFNAGLSNHVEYQKGRFIAVHLNNPSANMKITENVGFWSIGEIKHARNG